MLPGTHPQGLGEADGRASAREPRALVDGPGVEPRGVHTPICDNVVNPVFGAVLSTAAFGDFFSCCLVVLASLFLVLDVSLEISSCGKEGK